MIATQEVITSIGPGTKGLPKNSPEKLPRAYLEEIHGTDADVVRDFDRYISEEDAAVREVEDRHSKEGAVLGYSYEVMLVDYLIDAISQHVGVSREVVWQAFVRGMYEKDTLDVMKDFEKELVAPQFGKIGTKSHVLQELDEVDYGALRALRNVRHSQPDAWRAFVERLGIHPDSDDEKKMAA